MAFGPQRIGGNGDGPADTLAAGARARLRLAGTGMIGLLALHGWLRQTPLASQRALVELTNWLLAGGFVAAYVVGGRALRSLADGPRLRAEVLGFAAAFALAALLLPPFHSTDIYGYVNRGWQQARYGLNPYVATVADTPEWRADPMFRDHWVENPSPYGFLFTGLAGQLCRLSGSDHDRAVALFKLLNVAALGLAAAAVWWGCRRLGRPDAGRCLYLLLWNPLLVVHGLVNGHNDIVMAALTTVGVALALSGAWLLVLPALVAATLIKYAAGVTLPFAFCYLGKRFGWRKAATGAALAVALTGALAWPYLAADWHRLPLGRMRENATLIHCSLPALVCYPLDVLAQLRPAFGPLGETAAAAVRALFWFGFAAFVARLLWSRIRSAAYPPAALARDALLTQFVLVCLVSSKFHAWYLGMFLPLAFWLPAEHWLRRAVLALSGALMLSVTFVNQAHFLNALLMLVLPLAWAMRSPRPPMSAQTTERRAA